MAYSLEFLNIALIRHLLKDSNATGAGLLNCSKFNVNYFGVSEVEQWWTDFKEVAFNNELPPDRFWQFERSHKYGMGNRELTRNPMAPRPVALGGDA